MKLTQSSGSADQIKPGRTTVGNAESLKPADIKLSGTNILAEHCHFECVTDPSDGTDVVTLHAGSASLTMVNGLRIAPDKVRATFPPYPRWLPFLLTPAMSL